MSKKKDKFLKEVISYGCAVLVGPLLSAKEFASIPLEAPLFLVDGGADAALKLGLDPSRSYFTVGDGDSSAFPLDEKFEAKKDFSDLKGTLDLLPNEVSELKLFGFLGGRKDHELINFGEINQYLLKKNQKTKVFFSESFLALSSGDWKITCPKTVFSLMSLVEGELTIQGEVAYPVPSKRKIKPLSSQYLSNETFGSFSLWQSSPLYLIAEGIKFKAE